jgi:aminoglycoside 6'-N-acetyltransferase I
MVAMSDLQFYIFETEHLEAAGAVYAACFNLPPWEDGWSVASASGRLKALLAFPSAVGRVAFRNGRLAALAVGHSEPWTDGLHFYLNELCVDPACQRQSMGSALLRDLTSHLDDRGILDVYLLTERASAAEGFFQQHGFQPDADAVKLWRTVCAPV